MSKSTEKSKNKKKTTNRRWKRHTDWDEISNGKKRKTKESYEKQNILLILLSHVTLHLIYKKI